MMNFVKQVSYKGTVITIYEEDTYFVFSLGNEKIDPQLAYFTKEEAKEVIDGKLK